MQSKTIVPGEELSEFAAAKGYPSVERATTRDRGEGPYKRMVLRGARIIDGTGAPPIGPYDIVVEGGIIKEVVLVGIPGLPIKDARRPAKGDREIDCVGKLVTPGFIDSHVHIGTYFHAAKGKMPTADYVYKLWLAHGITTVREMACMNGAGWTLEQRAASAENRIAAPKIVAHAYMPLVDEYGKTIYTTEAAREWVRAINDRGLDGIKFFGGAPALIRAAIEEANTLGLRTGCHHSQMSVSSVNSLKTAGWGLTSTEHFYGVAEALSDSRSIQSYPTGYNYMDEGLRYNSSSQNFIRTEPGSTRWKNVLEQFLELDHTFVPTLAILEANRDLMRARNADWHRDYTHKTVWEYFRPNREAHCSHWFQWTTRNEVEWAEHFRRFGQFVNDYKNMGGRVVPGSDAGFTFQLYGFCFIRELERFQEAGFHPLEIIRAATSQAAELLGIADKTGTITPGKAADLLVHQYDPMEDLKYLYGTGAWRLDDGTGETEWHRGLEYTIKDGVVYDVEALLTDVRAIADESYAGDDNRLRL